MYHAATHIFRHDHPVRRCGWYSSCQFRWWEDLVKFSSLEEFSDHLRSLCWAVFSFTRGPRPKFCPYKDVSHGRWCHDPVYELCICHMILADEKTSEWLYSPRGEYEMSLAINWHMWQDRLYPLTLYACSTLLSDQKNAMYVTFSITTCPVIQINRSHYAIWSSSCSWTTRHHDNDTHEDNKQDRLDLDVRCIVSASSINAVCLIYDLIDEDLIF